MAAALAALAASWAAWAAAYGGVGGVGGVGGGVGGVGGVGGGVGGVGRRLFESPDCLFPATLSKLEGSRINESRTELVYEQMQESNP